MRSSTNEGSFYKIQTTASIAFFQTYLDSELIKLFTDEAKSCTILVSAISENVCKANAYKKSFYLFSRSIRIQLVAIISTSDSSDRNNVKPKYPTVFNLKLSLKRAFIHSI